MTDAFKLIRSKDPDSLVAQLNDAHAAGYTLVFRELPSEDFRSGEVIMILTKPPAPAPLLPLLPTDEEVKKAAAKFRDFIKAAGLEHKLADPFSEPKGKPNPS